MKDKYNASNEFMKSFRDYGDEEEEGYDEYEGKNDRMNVDHFNIQKKNFDKLDKLEKNFFNETDEYKKITQKEANEFLKNNEINVFGSNSPKPFTTFTSTGFPDDITKQLFALGFKAPTPIQAQSWPICVKGNDVIALAETGSGKTLGFLIPAIIHLRAQKKVTRGEGPIALILAPTRELAMQINKECLKFCKSIGIRTCCVYGGAKRNQQIYELKSGVEIVIATPGRLLDLLSANATNLDRCSYLTLDEADRMLDMGFEPQIRKIIENIRPDRQTLMFSATWNKSVQGLAVDFLADPLIVNVGSVDVSANHKVLQKFLFLHEQDKSERLLSIIDQLMDGRKILIFTMTKKKADEVCSTLRESGWPALAIHGDKSQQERDWVMQEFREGNSPIMVATDVAARGLDIKDIKLVVNFDLPKDIDSYVHRIGRTARAKNKGASVSFFTPEDLGLVEKLCVILDEAKQTVPPQLKKLLSLVRKKRGGGRGFRNFNNFNNKNKRQRFKK